MTQPLRQLFTQARKAKRWSQTQAAQKAGLSLTIVFKSEMQLVTKLHTALALCRIYGIPLDTLAACYWYERGEHGDDTAGPATPTGRSVGPQTAPGTPRPGVL
jgi:DNA-binding XRE family transcriptional regulator